MKSVIDLLQERDFVDAITHEEVKNLIKTPCKVYCGFDPTSDSLHLGNLVAVIGLAWFQKMGHTPVVLVGGATGMIGDPSGKSEERNLLTKEKVTENLKGITAVLQKLLDFNAPNKPIIVNNLDWFQNFSFLDFLRDVGKNFRLSSMLAKDSVKARLNSEEGISYTEFSYQILQAYDFLHLSKTLGVAIQIGGSDQWGNITQGTELVRKELGKQVSGLTFPLLTRSDGKKFGKSEKGAIWLSSEKLSEFEFYQYLYRVPDLDVIKLLKMLTFLDVAEIVRIEKSMGDKDYVPNTAQKILAAEVTRFVHGDEGLKKALHATEGAYTKGAELSLETLEAVSGDMPTMEAGLEETVGKKLIDLLVLSGLQESKGAARRLIQGGGVSVNNQKIDNVDFSISTSDLIGGRFILIQVGKKQKLLVRMKT